jgi:glycosyltransferase involved in cell wall biosynthesis
MITVTILTKNSQKYLREVLTALHRFDEVLIYDNGSTDNTLEIAGSFPNVTIYRGDFKGFGPTHNAASAVAKHDWILSIDSDEVATPEMVADIMSLDLDPKTVYSFPRHNFYRGTFIRWCGWFPDRQYRLYNRKKTSFSDAHVHEAILLNGMVHCSLKGPLRHYSYDSHADFLAKMQSYSDLFAKQNCGKKKASLAKAILHGLAAFFKAYILKRGILGGYEGFVISVYNGNTAFYKYLKLLEANEKVKKMHG